MKKNLLFVFIILLIFSSMQTFAAYPIPSYGVTVNSVTNFKETQPARGRREMEVKVNCGSSHSLGGSCKATVWVYSLDGRSVLGPYIVNGGETLSVPIDEREWGVIVNSDDEVSVDVWTSTPDSPNLEGQCLFNNRTVFPSDAKRISQYPEPTT
jgi:hypothetical protein